MRGGVTAHLRAFIQGVRHFNEGRYFEAHESFEELLDEVEDDDAYWRLLVALVQVAVGYHKASSGHAGAERMLGMGAEKLAAFPDVAFGVRVAALRERVGADLASGDVAGRMADDPPRLLLGRAQLSR
jgi:predicted metal-dependent hydrolase